MPDIPLQDFLPNMDDALTALVVGVALGTVVYFIRRAAERSRRVRDAARERLRTTGC